MRRLVATGAGVLLVAPAHVRAGEQRFLREAEAPRAIFPDATSSERKTLELTDEELATVTRALGRRVELRSYPYHEVREGPRVAGVVLVLDVLGQAMPITFAVGVGEDRRIRDLLVIAYREPRGEEIREARFRRQFTGKRLADPIALGRDIDAISGATISSRSAAYAARKALALAEVLHARAERGAR